MARPLEPEIKAMRTIMRAMEPLTLGEQASVRAWLRVEPSAWKPQVLVAPGQLSPMEEPFRIVTGREERFRMALEAIGQLSSMTEAKHIAKGALTDAD